MPISEQEQIADSVKQQTHGTSLEDVTEEGLERMRVRWPDAATARCRLLLRRKH